MKNLLIVSSLFLCSLAQGAGFEKSVMWSGKYAGYAGAAVSGVTGGQSLYFNPAGLAGPGDISLNLSPTWITTRGYLVTTTRQEESKSGMLPFGGALASYSFGRYGFGLGYYVVGGEKAYYGNVNMNPDSPADTALRPSLITDLELKETALGAAMEVTEGLRIGAAWRITKAEGELSTIKKNITNTAYSFLYVRNLKQTQYDGWRLGLQYEAPAKNWGAGLSYRSKVKFDARGTGTGQTTLLVLTRPTSAQTMSEVVRVGLVFPDAVNFGFHYRLNDNWKLLTGVDFVKYSENDYLYVTGTANGVALPNIELAWKDMWNFRLGAEYTGFADWALRAGYSLTTQVTSSTHAKATLPPPGTGHLMTVGAGYGLLKNLDLDGAFEYSFNTGTGSMSMPTDGFKEILAGQSTETQAKVIAIHTGVTYRF